MDRRALSPWCGPGARVAPRWRPDPPRRGGAAWLAALALAAAPAGADTAVVPADHATIQAAVTAVQGTAGALVRIDSNATFTELVTATESVAIEAGAGFTPTLRGTLGSCVGAGGCRSAALLVAGQGQRERGDQEHSETSLHGQPEHPRGGGAWQTRAR